MKYKETGYHLDNTDDLIEAAENVAAEYMDYFDYFTTLADVAENFDQSLEVFNPEKWMRLTVDNETGNFLLDNVIDSINEAEDNMFELSLAAEQECKKIWEYLLLGNDNEAKNFFVGDISKYTEEEIKDALDWAIENICDIPYHNQVQQDAKSFGDGIKDRLEFNRKFKA